MKFEVDKSKCAGCGACLRTCPQGAIKIGEDGKAFIDQNKCRGCGACQEICPFGAIKAISEEVSEVANEEQPKNLTFSVPTQTSYKSSINQRRGFGMGKGMGRGLGRGLGNGRHRGGRGGGRGRRMGQ